MILLRLGVFLALWLVLTLAGMTAAAFLLPVHIASWAPVPALAIAAWLAWWISFRLLWPDAVPFKPSTRG